MNEISGLIPHFLAVLLGGMLTSIGAGIAVRRPSGRALLGKTRWWGVTLYTVVSMGAVIGGLMWFTVRFRDPASAAALLDSPWTFFWFGLIMGAPFSLPVVLSTWNETRPSKIAARRSKSAAATREDRLKFAEDLARQIADFADKPREVKASLAGENGEILLFQGQLTRSEGDKLAAALRTELQDLGFERIEGDGWWSVVSDPTVPRRG